MKNNNMDVVEQGKQLYNVILREAHKGDIDEMYVNFDRHFDNLSAYGFSKEQSLKNYCIYKREKVLSLYKKR